jgi:hypothetical protein
MSISINTSIDPIDAKGVEDKQNVSIDESDDKFLIPYENINVNIHQPIFKKSDLLMDLLICLPDDINSIPILFLPTLRLTPEQDEYKTTPQRPEDDGDIIVVMLQSNASK